MASSARAVAALAAAVGAGLTDCTSADGRSIVATQEMNQTISVIDDLRLFPGDRGTGASTP